MMFSDIKENVLKETGISSAQYDLIISDFWRKIRELLSKPEDIKMGLRISGFGTWWMNYWRIKAVTKKTIELNREGYDKEYYLNIIENLKQLKKQYKNGKTKFNDE